MFLYFTRGLMRLVGGVHCGNMVAMEAEGQASWSLPEILAKHIRVIACWQRGTWSQGWWAFTCTLRAKDYVGSRVVDVTTVAGVREQRRVRSCLAACVLLCSLVAALRWTEKPLLSACSIAAALLCLAPIPPVNKRTSVCRRC